MQIPKAAPVSSPVHLHLGRYEDFSALSLHFECLPSTRFSYIPKTLRRRPLRIGFRRLPHLCFQRSRTYRPMYISAPVNAASKMMPIPTAVPVSSSAFSAHRSGSR